MNSAITDGIDSYDTIDLRVVIGRLWNRRWWIVASVLVCTTLAVLIAFMTTPIFRAAAVLVPASNDRGGGLDATAEFGGLASLAGLNLGKDSEKEEALAVLRSREFTEAFIHEKGLMSVLFSDKWDAKEQRWLPDVKPPTPAQAYKLFHRKVRSILQDRKTGLVTLQIDWKDGAQAAMWANELVARLNAEMRARAIAQADASVGYLERELQSTTIVGARDSISRLIESQIRQRMLANVTQEYAFRVVDRAMAPDDDDPIRPNKVLLVLGGAFVGGALAVVAIGLMGGLSSTRRDFPGART